MLGRYLRASSAPFTCAIGFSWCVAACSSSDAARSPGADGGPSAGGSSSGGSSAGGSGGTASGGTASGGTASGGTTSGGSSGADGGSQNTGGSGGGSGGAGGASSGGTANSGGAGAGGAAPVDPPPELVFTAESIRTPLLAIWGTATDDIYVAGGAGQIAHYGKDAKWTFQDSDTSARLTSIWGSGPSDVYISVRQNLVLHSTGDGTWEHQVTTAGYTFEAVWGSGPADVYAAGGGILRSNGDGFWRPAKNDDISAMWGTSATNLYAATVGPNIVHFTGGDEWREETTGADNLEDIHGTADDDIYAVGTGKVFHSTGNGTWTEQPTPLDQTTLFCIHAVSARAVYAGTSDGRLLRSGGDGRWFVQTVLAGLTIHAVWGTGADNVYLATSGGVYRGRP